MKKFLKRIVTLLAITTIALSTFAGCGLITTDTEKDLAQVVATVRIDESVESEDILKKEMRSAYMSYGYYYVAYYGYTESQTYALILDNLVSNRVVVQQARIELGKLYNSLVDDAKKADTDFKANYLKDAGANGTKIDYKSGDVDTLKKYLTEYEIAEALYTVKQNVNSVIESYETADDEETDEYEDETFTARASAYVEPEEETDEYELAEITPTDYDYKAADVTLNVGWETLKADATLDNMRALNLKVYNEYEIDLSTSAKKKAFSKAIKSLKKNGLVSESETVNYSDDADKVLEYSYFADLLKSQYESVIVNKYEASLRDNVEDLLDEDALWAQYKIDYEQQKFNYTNDRSAYETALDEADEDTFVICNPYDGETYGYVANLLIGFTDEQTMLLSEYSKKAGVTGEDKAKYREELLGNLVAKDQRETWAQSNYGTYAEGAFAFDSKYFASEKSVAKLGSFIGDVFGASSVDKENDDGVEETTWSFKNLVATEIPFDKFASDYLADLGIGKLVYEHGNADTVGKLTYNEELKARFDDLIYAFSTDPGSLGKYYGYTYSPVNSATTYVKEFANAAKALVESGVGSYTIVATDYGYHVMLCTKVINGHSDDEYNPETDEAKFKEDLKKDGTFANEYFTTKFDSICDSEVTKIANKLINGYKKEKVTKYRDTYSDLIDEADESDD